MNRELENHNNILSEIDDDADTTNGSLKDLTKKAKHVKCDSQSGGYCVVS
tara:strand:- start:1204 stop:1353 length:150 start_codon:yes stop_codon:yes gene_type:complete